MITASDDDLVKSHEEMIQLLRYAVPGAKVQLQPVRGQTNGEKFRRYTVTVEQCGHKQISAGDAYGLPCKAAPMAKRARELADVALEQLRKHHG